MGEGGGGSIKERGRNKVGEIYQRRNMMGEVHR